MIPWVGQAQRRRFFCSCFQLLSVMQLYSAGAQLGLGIKVTPLICLYLEHWGSGWSLVPNKVIVLLLWLKESGEHNDGYVMFQDPECYITTPCWVEEVQRASPDPGWR